MEKNKLNRILIVVILDQDRNVKQVKNINTAVSLLVATEDTVSKK